MRAELTSLNDCAVAFLSRATANLRWYYYIHYAIHLLHTSFNPQNLWNTIKKVA